MTSEFENVKEKFSNGGAIIINGSGDILCTKNHMQTLEDIARKQLGDWTVMTYRLGMVRPNRLSYIENLCWLTEHIIVFEDHYIGYPYVDQLSKLKELYDAGIYHGPYVRSLDADDKFLKRMESDSFINTWRF